MTLTLDIGNTAIKGGLFAGEHLARTFRCETDTAPPTLLAFLRDHLDGSGVERVGVVSVVPPATERLLEAIEAATGRRASVISAATPLPFAVGYGTPETLGSDRVAAVAGAWTRYPDAGRGGTRPLVVVDAGTAVTVEVLADGCYLGGAIAAGPDLTRRALARGTAQVPEVEPELPASPIGRSTCEAVQAGVMLPFLDGVQGLLRRTAGALGEAPFVVVTGGWGGWLAARIPEIDRVEPELVLHGVRALVVAEVP